MQEQALPAVDDADVLFAEQPELGRLRWALEHAGGFGLYFARCNVPVYRDRLARALEARLERPVVEVHLRTAGDALDAQLADALSGAPSNAVGFVYNLENLLPTTDAALQHRTLQELNWRRGAFARLERPLVFWLPEFALTILARGAPDFFDWYSGLYEFDVPESLRDTLIRDSLRMIPNDGFAEERLSAEQKQRWERVLWGLLEEVGPENGVKRPITAMLLARMGFLDASRGQFNAARDRLEQALAIFEKYQQHADMAGASCFLGLLHYGDDDFGRAREYYEQARVEYEKLGDLAGVGQALAFLGDLDVAEGNYDSALKWFDQALPLREGVGDRVGVAEILQQVGRVFQFKKDYTLARERFEQARAIAEALGNRGQVATSLENIGELDELQGDHALARKRYEQALIIREDLGDRVGSATILRKLAGVDILEGDYNRARVHVEQGLRIDEELDNRFGVALSLDQLGIVSRKEGEADQAVAFFARALLLFRQLGVAPLKRTRRDLASLKEQMGIQAFEAALKAAVLDARHVIEELGVGSEEETATT